jgi:dTDP-4-dehydrorhamnose 3,5-epimerase
MPFTFQPLAIPGLVLIKPRIFADARGYFLETYKRSEFEAAGIKDYFVQANHSTSSPGVVRGLHYQRPPSAQSKLVRVVKGKIWDVVVDLRRHRDGTPPWQGIELTAGGREMLYVPDHCAHGFSVAEGEAEVVYHVNAEYSPTHEGGIAWNDPSLAIDWKLDNPALSDRDTRWPSLEQALDHYWNPEVAQ